MTGPAYEGREAPPGAVGEFPNLGTIPPRPTVPDPAVREALTAALAEERQRSRNPLEPEMRPRPMQPAGTGGDGSMPMRAPDPPALTAAPRVPWEEAPLAPRPAAPAAVAPPRVPAPAGPTPAAPAPAPAPAPALPQMDEAPPAPPPPDLLAPGAGPPPPPSPDLLGPRTR